jgi:hypothetical protein
VLNSTTTAQTRATTPTTRNNTNRQPQLTQGGTLRKVTAHGASLSPNPRDLGFVPGIKRGMGGGKIPRRCSRKNMVPVGVTTVAAGTASKGFLPESTPPPAHPS